MQKFVWVILFFLAIFRIYNYSSYKSKYPDNTLIRITSIVASEPIRYENAQNLNLMGYGFYLPLYPEINYGDHLVVEGRVSETKLESVKLIDIKKSNNFLYKFRNSLLDFYKSNIAHPQSALVSGMVIGAKSDIGSDFWESLKKSGTAHVVVASGMNITLVAGFLVTFLTIVIPRGIALPLAMLGVWSYALISGFDAPIVRATIMGSFTFFAQSVGRLKSSFRILMLTAFLILIIWPHWVFDLGFWLSFLATLSIILFEERLRRIFIFIPEILRTDFSTTISAQIAVAPLLFYYFGQLNLLSPLINVLVLWTVPFITIIGMIGGIVGIIYEPLGKLIVLISYPLTTWFVAVVRFFGKTA